MANDAQNAGVTWNISGGGTLSGQTTGAVTYTAPASAGKATVTATSISDTTKSAAITITINAAPAVATTPTPTAATNGTAYSFNIPVTGGTAPLTWTISAGALPTGLTLSNGTISGTPNANATQSPYAFTVKVQDTAGVSATQDYSLDVKNPAAPVIAATAPPAGTNGSAYPSFSFTVANGGLSPFTWTETGALPPGMSMSTAGALSGTPTQTGSFPITVTVLDSSNPKQSASAAFTIQIDNPGPPTITTASLPDGSVGTPYSQTIQAAAGLAPYTWSISAGTLPEGLTLGNSTSNSVTISGTPTTVQAGVQFTVQVTDAASRSATHDYSMSVAAQPIIVTITNKVSSVQAGGAAITFNAVVQHDTQGVTWTLTANGTDCQPGCGVLSNPTSSSVTYTPPATVPGAPDNAPTLTATSVTDTSKVDTMSFTITSVSASCTTQGSESILNGMYAFSLSGFNANGFLTVVGSFTADGTGKITGGEADTNGALGTVHATITTDASSYSVGADGRGCVVITTSFGTFVTRISTGLVTSGAATKGRIVEWETGNNAYIASGQLLKQTPSAFGSGISGSYAFMTPGVDGAGNPFVSLGSLQASNGNFTAFSVDSNDAGNVSGGSGGTGTYTSFGANGRSTGNLSIQGQMSSTFAMYMVNASDLLVISLDTPGEEPVDSGEIRAQTGTFNTASLNGTAVFYVLGSHDPTLSTADVGIFTTNGNGSWSASISEDDGGTLSTNTPSGTYTVASNGRVTVVQPGKENPVVMYLTGANTGFMFGSGNSAGAGEISAQTGGPFTLSSANGTYFMGTSRTTRQSQEASVQTLTLATGTATGVGDYVSTQGLQPDDAFSDTYSVSANGGISVSDHPTTVTGYIINNKKFVIMDSVNSQYPSIDVGER
ncbi:MAG TPA: putative Ig domain-containing protein [Terriglobales bacterium]|nr:putative Ig domain-containing protein [Terriglobales bacterium]